MNTPAKNTLRLRLAPGLAAQLRNYVELTRLNKPIGIWLLLWPTLWALWLAGEGHPDPGVFVVGYCRLKASMSSSDEVMSARRHHASLSVLLVHFVQHDRMPLVVALVDGSIMLPRPCAQANFLDGIDSGIFLDVDPDHHSAIHPLNLSP